MTMYEAVDGFFREAATSTQGLFQNQDFCIRAIPGKMLFNTGKQAFWTNRADT